MAAQFPTTVPVYTNPTASMTLGSADHVSLHQNVQDDVVAIVNKFGIGASAPTARKILAGNTTAGTSLWTDLVSGATLIIAATNSSNAAKAVANYVCDGTSDQTEINAALSALPASGGCVLLAEGTFTIDAQIATAKASSMLSGMGLGTTIFAANSAGSNVPLVSIGHAKSGVVNLTIDGNKANNAGRTAMELIRLASSDGFVSNVYGINSAGANMRVTGSTGNIISDSRSIAAQTIGINVGATGHTIVQGCVVTGNGSVGLYTSGTRTNIVGGHYSSNGTFGINADGGTAHVVGATIVSNGSHGLHCSGGLDHLIEGNVVRASTQHGIVALVDRVSIVGNHCMENGQGADNTYANILVSTGSDCFIDGNMVRRGALANKSREGINVQGGSNHYIGANDTYDGGTTSTVADAGTNTRRLKKLQLDYNPNSDLATAASLTANSWNNVGASNNFRVDSNTSLIEVSVMGHGLCFIPGGVTTEIGCSILIDGATRYVISGSSGNNSSPPFINPLNGGTITIAGLTVGTHTVQVQIMPDQTITTNWYLRPGTKPNQELLRVQVREVQR